MQVDVVGTLPTTELVKKQKEPTSTEPQSLRSIGSYARELRPLLPRDLLKPCLHRAFVFVGLVFSAILALSVLVSFPLGILPKLLLGLWLGYCFGAMAFITHEVLHGSVVRKTWLQDAIGFVGFAPFLISPTFWRFWHNRLHHGHTQKILKDPDAFPTRRVFAQSKYLQRTFKFTPGSGFARSYLYFFFWFFFHNLANQVYLRFRNKNFAELDHRRSSVEMSLQLLLMSTYVYFVGEHFIYGVLSPVLVMNYMLMSYISTNHNLSPLTKENDPLVNSLSVGNGPVWEFLHFNFGYHVEHHLFPTMNPSKAKLVHRVLLEKFPDRYQWMSKSAALKQLYRSPRLYKSPTQLVHPYSGDTHPTL